MRIRPKLYPATATDDHRKGLFTKALTKVSVSTEKAALSSERREIKATTAKLKVNIRGNRTGMHLHDNPPSSEDMRKRRAMRRLWNKQMPSLHCSGCQFSSQCPQFRAGYQCAFQPFIDSHSIESEQDLIFYAKELLGENIQRAQLSILIERLSGAKPDLDTSEALSHLFAQLMQLHTKLTEPDASLEIETSDRTIIGRLFGGLDSLLGTTRDQISKPLETPMLAAEINLDNQVQNVDNRAAIMQRDLIGELALIKSGVNTTLPPSQHPIQEEL